MILPVRHILRSAFQTIGRNFRLFVVISILMAIVTLIATKVISTFVIAVAGFRADPSLVETVVWILVISVVNAPVEIHWFRILLLGEPHNPGAYFRFGPRAFRYAAVGIVVSALLASPSFVTGYVQERLIVQAISFDSALALVYQLYAANTVAQIAISTLFAACLSPLLAAIAVDRESRSIGAILRLTRGHRWQMAIIFLAGFEVLKIASIAMDFAFAGNFTGLSVWDAVYVTYIMWTSFCYVVIIAEIYWELEQGRSLQALSSAFD